MTKQIHIEGRTFVLSADKAVEVLEMSRVLSILTELDRIVKTVEERHEEQLLMIKAVQAENSILRVKLNKLNEKKVKVKKK